MVRYGEKCLKIETDSITSLPANICEMLETGEAVVVLDGNKKKTYIVTHKELYEDLRLTYCDNSKVETIFYKRTEGVWGYDKTETSELGGGGGTKLYKHHIVVNGDISVGGITFVGLSFNIISAYSSLVDDFTKLNHAITQRISLPYYVNLIASQVWNSKDIGAIEIAFYGNVYIKSIATNTIGTVTEGTYLSVATPPSTQTLGACTIEEL